MGIEKPLDFGLAEGGVSFYCGLGEGFLLNHCVKIGHRILWRIDEFKCNEFSKLERKIQTIPWNFFVGTQEPQFKVSSHSSRLFHKKNIEETCINAFKKYRHGQPVRAKASNSKTTIHIRFDDNVCTISVDTSGEHLHRRGYKTLSTEAPLRENLAAGLLNLTLEKINPPQQSVFIDPMCGSGTFAGELWHLNRALFYRKYAYEDFFIIRHIERFGHRRLKDWNQQVENQYEFWLGDQDSKSISVAQKNLSMLENVSWANEELSSQSFTSSNHPKWIVFNPPYGIRLKKSPQTLSMDQLIHSLVEKYDPIAVGVVKERDKSASAPNSTHPLQLVERFVFLNNGVPVEFLLYQKP
ncbi:MAG: hypothetical protein R2827_16310 [Bdellovibrionales bacterium]